MNEVRVRLAAIVKAKKEEGCSDDHIIAAVTEAGRAIGADASTISRVLLAAGIRQRAERIDCGMQKPKDLTKVEAEVKSLLSRCSRAERVAILARLTIWAAAAG